jgi:2-polyprenyl-6-hydroxyphenyl methylase/3-demethylubiquinone-9 3-methyltransferase
MYFRWRVAQFFEIRWWRRYLASREKEPYLSWKKAYWADFIRITGLVIPNNASVLDAGCGPAGIFTALPHNRVDALDPLIDAYQSVLPHFRRDDYPNTRFINVPLERFSPNQPYDFVFCLNAINHMADLPACLTKLAESTCSGGTLVVSTDAHRYSWVKSLFQLLPADLLHPHQYDRSEYETMLSEQGFCHIRTTVLRQGKIFDYCLFVFERTR